MDTAIAEPQITSDVLVFPFVEGQKIFPDEFMVALWRRTRDEGILPWCFPGQGEISLEAFISMLRKKWLVLASSASLNQFLGYGWLFEVEGEPMYRKASLGFCFFKQFHGTQMIREAARKAVSWWFENVQLQVLYGMIRTDNLSAIRFSRLLGFQRIGVAPRFFSGPGGTYDGYFTCVTREQWEIGNGWTVGEHTTSPNCS